ncbi:hypothetical protein AAK917_09500 [Oscillospiraceae bacterium 52-8]
MERIKAGARDLWQGSLCILLLWGILFRGSYAKDGILRGLTSCYQVIIPALFPFLVVSHLIMGSRLSLALESLFSPVSRFLFRSGRQGGAIFSMAMIGGFPVGPKLLRGAVDRGELDREEARRLALFCVAPAPAFVITGVGGGMFHSMQLGAVLYLCSVLGAVLTGTLLSRRGPKRGKKGHAPTPAHQPRRFEPFSAVFVQAVSSSVQSLLSICGYVILFSALLQLLGGCLPLPDGGKALLSGLLEITSGCLTAAALPGRLGPYLTAFFLGFCGLSAVCQMQFCLGNLASIGKLLGARLLCGGLVLGLFSLFFELLPSPVADVFFSSTPPPLDGAVNAPLTSVLLLLFCLAALFTLSRKSRVLLDK